MPIDQAQLTALLGELGVKIKDVLLSNVKDLLDEQKAAGADFLKEEVADAAYWTVQYAKASDAAQKEACQAQLDRIKDRTIDALLAAAVNASKKTRGTLKTIVSIVFEYGVKVLPKVLGIVALMV